MIIVKIRTSTYALIEYFGLCMLIEQLLVFTLPYFLFNKL